jgi:hypothetical protein
LLQPWYTRRGHVLAGLISGFEILSVRVGPINLRLNKAREWSVNRRDLLKGLVTAQFRNVPGPRARWQCFAFLIGGPAANLFTSLALAPFSFNRTAVSAIIGYLAVVSTFVGLVNLIPFKTKLGYSDGTKIFWLLFDESKREALIFRFSLRARLYVISVERNKGLNEALAKTDDLIRRFSQIPGPPDGLIEILSKFRAKLEMSMKDPETTVPIETAEV